MFGSKGSPIAELMDALTQLKELSDLGAGANHYGSQPLQEYGTRWISFRFVSVLALVPRPLVPRDLSTRYSAAKVLTYPDT